MRGLNRFSLAAWVALGCGAPAWPCAGDEGPVAAGGPLSPAESLASIAVRPGMQIELVAAEPLVADPINLDWGPDGRLWVVEMGDYPTGADRRGAPGGRIRCLTDDDGDGRYDRSQVFLDALPYPTAVLAWRDGVLVMAAAELIFAADRDGDGRAEHREVLWDGFHTGNPQHLATGFRRGLDGWIYGGNVQPGTVVRRPKTGAKTDLGGRDFRFHPNRGQIEPLTGVTQFLRTRDDWGNWFGNNNINPMYHYVLDERYLKRNPYVAYPPTTRDVSEQPGSAPVFPRSRTLPRFNDFHTANRFTSACSAIVYRDELLGPEFVGNSFVCEPVHNLVHREIVRPEGVTFRSRRADDEQTSEFLASTDHWFRPTTVETGPDGALWVVDMYRQVIEHPEWIPPPMLAQLDVSAGSDRGRIYRVFPADRSPRPIARLDTLSDLELVAALDHPNGWQRDLAGQLLRERRSSEAVEALRALVRRSERPIAKVHALHVLADRAPDRDTLAAAMADPHPGVRAQAAALATRISRSSRRWDEEFSQLARDPDPRVRLEVAYALGDIRGEASARTLFALAIDEPDDSVYAAAASSLSRHCRAPLDPSLLTSQGVRAGALFGDVLTTVWGRCRSHPSGSSALFQPHLLEVVRSRTPAALAALARFATAVRRQGYGPGAPLFDHEQDQHEARNALGPAIAAAEAALHDSAQPTALRLQSLRIVALDPNAASTGQLIDRYLPLLTASTPRELQSAAVEELAAIGSDDAAEALLAAWPNYDAPLRDTVLDVLLRRVSWQGIVLRNLSEGGLRGEDLSAAHRQRLRSLDAPRLREAAEKLLPDASGDRQEVVEHYVRACGAPGDAQRGRKVFAERCATCHRLYDEGHAVGPELTALVGRPSEVLLEAILDPNRALESRFMAYVAVTHDGLTYQGVWRGETAGVVTLVGPEERLYEIPRQQLERLTPSNRSLMPEGLERDVSPEAMSDLLAYLRQRTAPPKQVPGNQPAPVAPDPLRRELFCLPENAALFGPSLTLEAADRNLGHWTTEQDYATWTIDVPRAERYAALLEWACPDDEAGNHLVVEVGSRRVTHQVRSTGGSSQYQRAKIGEIDLPAGRQEVLLRAEGPPRGPLVRLRGLSLRPLGEP